MDDVLDQGITLAEDQAKQGKTKTTLLLTPALRINDARANAGGFVSQRAGLSNLHTALTSNDEVKGESIVQNLREAWVAPKSDEYYEDEADEGLTLASSDENWTPEEGDQAKQAEAARLLEKSAKPKSDMAASDTDPDFEWRREGLGQIVQSFEEDAEDEASQKDSVLSELRSFRTPVEPAGEDDERITIPRFRHRGWSYDLASAAGWNTERTAEPEPDEPKTQTPSDAEESTATQSASVETQEETVEAAEDAPTSKVEAVARELAPQVAEDITPKVAEKASTAMVDGTMIDQEMLREIVGDILREEMSGALGERITRNVRKLVRREIHRAMMTQDFD